MCVCVGGWGGGGGGVFKNLGCVGSNSFLAIFQKMRVRLM